MQIKAPFTAGIKAGLEIPRFKGACEYCLLLLCYYFPFYYFYIEGLNAFEIEVDVLTA